MPCCSTQGHEGHVIYPSFMSSPAYRYGTKLALNSNLRHLLPALAGGVIGGVGTNLADRLDPSHQTPEHKQDRALRTTFGAISGAGVGAGANLLHASHGLHDAWKHVDLPNNATMKSVYKKILGLDALKGAIGGGALGLAAGTAHRFKNIHDASLEKTEEGPFGPQAAAPPGDLSPHLGLLAGAAAGAVGYPLAKRGPQAMQALYRAYQKTKPLATVPGGLTHVDFGALKQLPSEILK